ncbi:hypothetical protein JHK82_051203 [Glycine max]|nr:hypothetical protein JHK86_051046 [Glycine max]KAG5092425.1 hypothetical protein JHK82_051203 [Glycine max]KAG5095495.1 hypothetical protein JHK84_051083 [Glycine max]
MFSAKKAELHPQNTVLQIKQDDKFFSRLLSKEGSMSKPSFRMAVAVPFVWESQPGTPKYTFSEDTLPPLTPPPSYFVNSNKKNKPLKKRSRSNIFLALFPKLNLKKKNILSPSSPTSPSSLWSTSDHSSKVVPMEKHGRRRFLSFGSSFDFRGDEEEESASASATSPTSTLCFGISRSTSTLASIGFRGKSYYHAINLARMADNFAAPFEMTWQFISMSSGLCLSVVLVKDACVC